MPLLDHFQSPISSEFPWPSFHVQWATFLVGQLNRILPGPRYKAHAHIHLGPHVEADVVEEEATSGPGYPLNGSRGGVAVQSATAPPAAMTMPIAFPDSLEVQVQDYRNGRRVIGIIELVSPANKDRPESRDDFAQKCAVYLRQGIGLVIVDLVSDRSFNLHNNLVRVLHQGNSFLLPDSDCVYITSYRPVHAKDQDFLEFWPFPLLVGRRLPLVPFALRGRAPIMIDFEESYEATCQNAGIA